MTPSAHELEPPSIPGRFITHKREIVTLYLQGYLTPKIASKTNHSKEAVDRYIRDFEAVRTVFKHGIHSIDEIAQITKLSKKVA